MWTYPSRARRWNIRWRGFSRAFAAHDASATKGATVGAGPKTGGRNHDGAQRVGLPADLAALLLALLSSRRHLRARPRLDRRLDERGEFVRIPVSHDTVDHTWMVRTIEGLSTSCSTATTRCWSRTWTRSSRRHPVGDARRVHRSVRRGVRELPRLRGHSPGGQGAAFDPAGQCSTSAATGLRTTHTTSRRWRPNRCDGSPASMRARTGECGSTPTSSWSIFIEWTTTHAWQGTDTVASRAWNDSTSPRTGRPIT